MSMNESLLGAEAKAAPPSSAPYSIQAGGAPAVAASALHTWKQLEGGMLLPESAGALLPSGPHTGGTEKELRIKPVAGPETHC